MPDISMCANERCNKKEECYRKQANPSKYWQSYSYHDCSESNNWKYFLKNTKKEEDDDIH